ncbi:MAG: hypothetical protein LBH73_09220 [Spirochaetaceae bacterium]|jgi:uncharacterized protein (TIGR03545 family)|nr:hypothetical protein [Spirochaetaceae bacterium]
MAKKAPGALRKPITEKRFEKRFLKYLEQPDDKKFFKSCFASQDGTYLIKDSLDDQALKRLKPLYKAIKKNRQGALRFLPVIVCAAVIAGIVFFVTVLMNPLIERGIEHVLETVFEARSDVDNFRLYLTRFRVSIGGITVADRDEPMKNLFHIGRMEFRLNPRAIFRGKVYIEEIRADSIAFGTSRTVSGELPAYKRKVKPPKEAVSAPPLIDIKNFDARALLAQEMDKLRSPAVYDEAAAAYTAALEEWKGRVDSAKGRAGELQERARPVLAINAGSMNNPETIAKTVADISALISSVQAAANDANALVSGVEADLQKAVALEQSARASITADINYLKSLVDLGSGAAFSALEPSIRAMLSDSAEQYIAYGMRALEVFEKIKAMSASMPKSEAAKAKPPSFRGRDVSFPSLVYPRFFLGTLASDFTLYGWNWAFELKSVSSEPDLPDAVLPNQPTILRLNVSDVSGESSMAIAFEGNAHFGSASTERFNTELRGSGYPLSTGLFSAIGIDAFQGLGSAALAFSGRKNGDISGSGNIAINEARIADPRGTLAEAVDEAIRQAQAVNLGLNYEYIASGKDEFSISTNIASLVTDIVKRSAERYVRQAMADIERVVRDYATAQLEGKFISKEELNLVFNAAKGDRDALNGLQNTLNDKRNELERRVRNAAEEAAAEAKRRAEEEIRDRARDAIQGGGIRLPF